MTFFPTHRLNHADDEYLIDWSARRALGVTWAIFIAACLIRLLLNGLVWSPYIFNDEPRYLELARSVGAERGMYWGGHLAFFPCWLYPLLISPATNAWPFPHSLAWIRFINTIFMNLAIPLTFFWAREIVSLRRAVLAAAFVALLPGMAFSATIMTESVFMPAVVLGLWMAWRYCHRPTFLRGMLTGLCAALALHIKPQGLLLPLIIFPFVLISDFLRPANSYSSGSRPGFPKLFALHVSILIGFVLGILPRLAVVRWIEHPGEPFQWTFFFGLYHGMGFNPVPFTFSAFFDNLWLQWATWLVCCGIFPGYVLFLELIRALRGWLAFERALLLLLALIASLAVTILIARHMLIMGEHEIPYERYIFVIYPTLLILYANHLPLQVGRAWRPLVGMAGLIPAILFGFFIYTNFTLSSNSPALTTALLLGRGLDVARQFGWVLIGLGAAIFILTAFPWRTSSPIHCGLILILLAFNLGWYGFHERVIKHINRPIINMARKVDRKIGPSSILYIAADHFSFVEYFTLSAFHRYRFISANGKALGWMDMKIEPDGRWEVPLTPEEPWLVTHRRMLVSELEGKKVESAMLYRLKPGQLVQFDLDAPTTQTELARRKRLPIYIYPASIPEFSTGRITRMDIRIQNTMRGPFGIPASTVRVGYHWTNLQNPADKVWDDQRALDVPSLEGSELVILPLYILAPSKPGSWQLQLQPYVDVDGRHEWKTPDQPPDRQLFNIEVKP